MIGKKEQDKPAPTDNWSTMLRAKLIQNAAATIEKRGEDGGLAISVPNKKPSYLVPPLTWIIRPNEKKVLHLDTVGAFIWDMCDGNVPVETVIEKFAQKHRLTFHESRVSVTTYAKSLLQRGALAVAIEENAAR